MMVRPMMVRQARLFALAVVAVSLVGTSCGGGSSPVQPPPPRVTATPTEPPPVNNDTCTIGPGDPGAICSKSNSSETLVAVNTAIDTVVQQKPELVNTADEAGTGSGQFKVLDQKAFLEAVVANLRTQGLCAEVERDLGLFIHVKSSQLFSEDFNLILSSGHIRRGFGSFKFRCQPASFPVDAGPNAPPPGSGCGRPYPPPISRFAVRNPHTRSPWSWTLDSTPLVGPNADYCAAIGYTDGRNICPVRAHTDDERTPCETWRVGYAADTGRAGPTWRKEDGSFCTGMDSGCENHPDNQYSLIVYIPNGAGKYTVCAENNACATVTVAF